MLEKKKLIPLTFFISNLWASVFQMSLNFWNPKIRQSIITVYSTTNPSDKMNSLKEKPLYILISITVRVNHCYDEKDMKFIRVLLRLFYRASKHGSLHVLTACCKVLHWAKHGWQRLGPIYNGTESTGRSLQLEVNPTHWFWEKGEHATSLSLSCFTS